MFFFFFFLSADQLSIPTRLFRIKLNLFFGVFLFLFLLLRKISFKIDGRILLPTIWIGASFLISFWFSPDLMRTGFFVLCYFFYLLIFFLVPFTLVQEMEEKHFFSLYSLSFWVTGGFAVFQILNISLGIEDHFIRQLINSRLPRVNAFNHEPSFYVLYMSLFVMYLAARYLLSGERFKMVVFGFILLALSFTTSSVFATLLFIILGFVYAKRQKVLKRWLWLSSSLLFLWGIAIVLFWKPFQLFVFKMGGENPLESHSIAFRWEGIIKSLRLFFEYPFFGVGYGGVVPHLYKEAYLWERGNEMPLNYDLGEIPPFEPTNVLTEVAASFGLFGIFGFLMLVYSFWQTYRECVQIQQLEHGERVRLKALAFSLLMGILLLQVNQSLFRSYIWVHAAITYGYFCKVKKKYVLISNQQA